MIGYTTVGTNDMARAAAFYDRVLELMGARRRMEEASYIAWGVESGGPMFSIHLPADGGVATVGNGCMVALRVADTERVAAVHQRALSLGAADEGAPGPRGPGFFAAYFRDLDGNKLNVHCLR